MKKLVWVAVIVWMAVKLGLMVKVPFGVTIDQAKTAVEATAKDKMFVANLVVQRAVIKTFGTSELSLRIYGFGLYVLLMLGVMKLLIKFNLKDNTEIILLVLAVNPWITNLSLFYLPELLSLTAIIWFEAMDNRWATVPIGIIAALSSPIGIAWGVLAGIRSLIRSRRAEAVVLYIVIIAVLFVNRQLVGQGLKEAWVKNLNPTIVGMAIDEDQKINFLATNKTYQLPTILRRLVNNKPTYILRNVIDKTISILDPTAWTAPNDAWVVTGMSGFPTKGNSQLFYFWEMPLMVMGLAAIKKRKWVWLLAAAVSVVVIEQRYIATSGLLLLPVMVWLIVNGWKKVPVKILYPAAIILYSIAGFYFYKQLFLKQEDSLTSQAQIYRQTALMARRLTDWPRIVVTDRIGPTQLMFKFYGFSDPKITFRQFDLMKESPAGETIYIGLPGEFAPGSEITEKINYGDEPVYKFGKGIWAGR